MSSSGLTITELLSNSNLTPIALGDILIACRSGVDGAVILTGTGTGNLVFATSPILVTPVLGAATATSINNVAITPPVSLATITIASGKTFNCSNTLTLSGTDGAAIVFGAGGTVLYNGGALGTPASGNLSNCTGLPINTGVSGLGTGVATFLATPSSANLSAVLADETGFGAAVFNNGPTLVTPNLGTPNTGTLTNCTGLPISTGVSGLGTGVSAFLAAPSSANLITAITDETGSGALVFATNPTLVTPVLGVATVTSINKVAITAPATSATLTIANGKTLTVSNTLTLTGTDSSSIAFGAGGTVLYNGGLLGTPSSGILTNCTITGGVRSYQIFTSGTAATYTKPANVSSILVEVVGGGGGGGGSVGGASTFAAGGGGGSGGYARLYIPSASGTYTYTVGGGGTAGANTGGDGGTGSTTTFGASLQATGGLGGSGASVGVVVGGTSFYAGGTGGIGSNGDINSKGTPGIFGCAVLGNIVSGSGGSSLYGGAAAGKVLTGAGNDGGNYGGGGGGACSTTSGALGGVGSAGIIIVWEFS